MRSWIFARDGFWSGRNPFCTRDDLHAAKAKPGAARTWHTGQDWAILKTDRALASNIPTLEIGQGFTLVWPGDELLLLGHERGRALVTTGNAKVLEVSDFGFTSDLRSMKANSGAPIFRLDDFRAKRFLVEGVQNAGNAAYKKLDLAGGKQCTLVTRCKPDPAADICTPSRANLGAIIEPFIGARAATKR